MARTFSALVALALVTLAGMATSCRSPVDGRPEERCFAACNERASARCDEDQCARGCRFVLDRLVEREDKIVLACIANGKGACNDEAWAQCASRVGVHADGGPPVPAPISEEEGAPADDDDKLDDDPPARAPADAGAKDAAPSKDASAGKDAGAKAAPPPKGKAKK